MVGPCFGSGKWWGGRGSAVRPGTVADVESTGEGGEPAMDGVPIVGVETVDGIGEQLRA